MKKLLALLLLSPFAYSESESTKSIYKLDSYKGGIRVLCINNYVFVTRNEEGLTQMMRGVDRGQGGTSLYPVSCKRYKKNNK